MSLKFKLGKYYISRIAGVLMSKPGKVPMIRPRTIFYSISPAYFLSTVPIQPIQYDHLISIHQRL